jgi:hypothetical protein
LNSKIHFYFSFIFVYPININFQFHEKISLIFEKMEEEEKIGENIESNMKEISPEENIGLFR